MIIAIFIVVSFVAFLIFKFTSKKQFNTEQKKTEPDFLIDLVKSANEKAITEDYRGAIAIADRVLTIDSENYYALIARANSLEPLNFNLDAIDDYEKALTINNSDPNILGLLGLTYRKIGELDKGQHYLKLSLDKGLDRYRMSYELLFRISEGARKIMITKGKAEVNLQRRNPEDFIDDLSEVDQIKFKNSVLSNLHIIESELSLNPNDNRLKKLYEFAKTQIG